jgi:cation diffusion facilitator CzcD-associated flavoprotein CzcO
MQKIFEVAIIGAGISGLGASYQLSNSGIDHIIIESRNRIGGRIASK